MRLFLLLLGLALLVLVPFFVWGDGFMALFEGEGARRWLEVYGRGWAWLAGVLLLVSDLVLPVPATAVIGGLGYVYGGMAGGFLGAAGSFLSGLVAYEGCRRWGMGAADRVLGAEDRVRAERIFAGGMGGWLVALSRWMPLLPEMTACMAGLTGMGRGRFYAALGCGCVPMGLTFAWIGATGVERPGLALGLSAGLPAVLYGVAALYVKWRSGEKGR